MAGTKRDLDAGPTRPPGTDKRPRLDALERGTSPPRRASDPSRRPSRFDEDWSHSYSRSAQSDRYFPDLDRRRHFSPERYRRPEASEGNRLACASHNRNAEAANGRRESVPQKGPADPRRSSITDATGAKVNGGGWLPLKPVASTEAKAACRDDQLLTYNFTSNSGHEIQPRLRVDTATDGTKHKKPISPDTGSGATSPHPLASASASASARSTPTNGSGPKPPIANVGFNAAASPPASTTLKPSMLPNSSSDIDDPLAVFREYSTSLVSLSVLKARRDNAATELKLRQKELDNERKNLVGYKALFEQKSKRIAQINEEFRQSNEKWKKHDTAHRELEKRLLKHLISGRSYNVPPTPPRIDNSEQEIQSLKCQNKKLEDEVKGLKLSRDKLEQDIEAKLEAKLENKLNQALAQTRSSLTEVKSTEDETKALFKAHSEQIQGAAKDFAKFKEDYIEAETRMKKELDDLRKEVNKLQSSKAEQVKEQDIMISIAQLHAAHSNFKHQFWAKVVDLTAATNTNSKKYGELLDIVEGKLGQPGLSVTVQIMKNRVEKLGEEFAETKSAEDSREAALQTSEKKIESMTNWTSQVDVELKKTNQRLEAVEVKQQTNTAQAKIATDMAQMDARIEKQDQITRAVPDQISTLEKRVASLDQRFQVLRQQQAGASLLERVEGIARQLREQQHQPTPAAGNDTSNPVSARTSSPLNQGPFSTISANTSSRITQPAQASPGPAITSTPQGPQQNPPSHTAPPTPNPQLPQVPVGIAPYLLNESRQTREALELLRDAFNAQSTAIRSLEDRANQITTDDLARGMLSQLSTLQPNNPVAIRNDIRHLERRVVYIEELLHGRGGDDQQAKVSLVGTTRGFEERVAKLETSAGKDNGLAERVGKVEGRLGTVEAKVEDSTQLNVKVDAMRGQLGAVETKVESLEHKMSQVEVRMTVAEQDIVEKCQVRSAEPSGERLSHEHLADIEAFRTKTQERLATVDGLRSELEETKRALEKQAAERPDAAVAFLKEKVTRLEGMLERAYQNGKLPTIPKVVDNGRGRNGVNPAPFTS